MKISKSRGLNEEEGEDVELVTEQAQLKTGAVVWISPCGRCGGHHRMFLGNAASGAGLDRVIVTGFRATPIPPCCPRPGATEALIRFAPGLAELYVVVDPLLGARAMAKKEMAR